MKNIKEIIINAFENSPLLFGILLLGIGVYFLILRLEYKNTFKMKDYSISEWGTLVYTWGFIIIIFLLSFYLIVKSLV